ncbi:MAG: hypothetical protein IT225_00950, partial [Flavobacteriales bacterium]|nr:hypothetical protein [Flavobacteriales bacterium]
MLRLLPLSVLPFPCLLSFSVAVGQTVIIQEVSNGPAGSMEYVELLVVPDTPADPCIPATCLDLRGWMIDDNNGYHGSNGVAQGAARFSDHLLWSCVPVGTLITIYNAEDPNPALPPDDVDLSDGDCSIVIPSSDPSLLTYTNSTPAPVPCDDPGGWGTDPTPNWQSNLAMANSGDCMRVCDPAGCLVFAFCFGSAATNATVHFPSNGGDLVWYFNDGDPTDVANWVQGCAGDLAACGADDQSPGGSNSPANASWMALFNNGCVPPTPIAPLVVTATTTTACGCDAVATAAASGSTGPYTFTWSDATWNTLVQNSNTATGLCAGSYHVIATSTTGCSDTATVVVTGGGMLDPGSDAVVDLCSDDGPVDLFTLLGGTPDPSGQWSPALPGGSLFDTAVDPPGDYTYSFQSAPGCP